MALIQFDDNLPKRFTPERKSEISAQIRAQFANNPPVFIDTVTPALIPHPNHFCAGCLLPLDKGVFCSPCAQKTENVAFIKETSLIARAYGYGVVIAALVIVGIIYFSKI